MRSPNKPAPRVVFDCAAKCRGRSLNSELLKGPDNTSALTDVLFRFRLDHVAVVADIKSMFHQVFVPPDDRKKLSFLWWSTNDFSKEPDIYEMNVHVFGATSSPSVCEFALRKTAKDNSSKYSAAAVNAVLHDFYVDDMLKSFNSTADAISTSHEIKRLLSEGGFKLTKWISNREEVVQSFDEKDRAPATKRVALDASSPKEKTLGVMWDLEADTLSTREPMNSFPMTRRGVLSTVASIYDPLGMISPLFFRGKAINQELCIRNIDWDSMIPEDLLDDWNNWTSELKQLSAFFIPRCIKPSFQFKEVELHHFSDASDLGYGTVSYIRFISETGEIHCAFLYGRARVKPLKKGITIPRLELNAAANLVVVNEMITSAFKERLDITRTTYWTDSMIVLKYIYNETKALNVYVTNRVAKIRDQSEPSQWKHVRSCDNPADIASRGLFAHDQRWKMWIQGPDFLYEREPAYTCDENFTLSDEDDGVIINKKVNSVSKQDNFWSDLFHRFSSWKKLLRSAAWLLRAKSRLQGLGQCQNYLELEELEEAERFILKVVQNQSFDQSDISNRLKKLNPRTFEDGILRVGGRLENSDINDSAKHPVILPSNHEVTRLLIKHYHEANGHSGAQHTLANLRERYWIIKGLSAVQKQLRKCHECRRINERPGRQVMAPLPAIRVKSNDDQHPFSIVGVDYFGPLNVTRCVKTRSRSNVVMKRYGCIFTCLKTRAIHLELARDLSTDSFINVLHRFIARRGPPRLILSDNGTNFKCASAEVVNALKNLNQDCIQRNMSDKGIAWRFNPPAASHQGGVWERLIRSVRKILTAMLRNRIANEDTLHTFLCEAEKILNDRPLTRVSNDINDCATLTPNHILLFRRNPTVNFVDTDGNVYQHRWKIISSLADEFWLRWRKEYLPMLQERQIWLTKSRNFATGDLVLIVNPSASRGQWLKGIVTDTFPGPDGCVREVIVRTASGSLRRDVRKLCLLEEDIVQSHLRVSEPS